MQFKYKFLMTIDRLKLEATITQFITVPYVEHEFEEMDRKRRRMIEHFGLEKVVERIAAESKSSLRKQIMQVYKRHHPMPIVVYTDAFEARSYITRLRYRDWLPWTVREQVFFQRSGEQTGQQYKVLCRIIGRNQRATHNHSEYLVTRHNFEGGFATDSNDPNHYIARLMSRWT